MRNKNAKKQTDILPIVLIAIGFVLIAGVLLWQVARGGQNNQAANSASEQNAPQSSSVQNAADYPTNVPNAPDPGVQRISLTAAKNAFDSRSALFLDARDPDSYKAAHIPGAVNIPLAQLENRINELNPNQWIITYCT